jgi:lysozyme
VKTSDRGIELIKNAEGCRLQTYLCPAGIPTIAYGRTQGVKMGMKITQAEADEMLRQDLAEFEAAVTKYVRVPLTQHQFDALVCWTYNVGIGALSTSTLLKKLNAKDYAGAANEFERWNKGGGKVLPGLVKRRVAEKALFLN